ncbi:MAG: cytochrome c, partial [Alphaproteobacteria bacterium]|nr:cytochrome c [Alphaproteobacteria bacterium]
GFLKAPIPFTWLRAPYLHNASVPTLRALLWLDERPASFCRGHQPAYDQMAIGVKVVLPKDDKCPDDAAFLYDTTQEGNSAAGHDFPARGSVSRPDLEALLEYLGTL